MDYAPPSSSNTLLAPALAAPANPGGAWVAASIARPTEQLSNPGAFQAPVRLALCPHAQPLPYEVTVRWEERLRGEVRRTIVQKSLTIASVASGPHLLVEWTQAPPTLRKPDLLALEEIALLLADIYQKLTIETTTAGTFMRLANHAEIAEAWAHVSQELVVRYGEEEELTTALRAAVASQVQQPELLLQSLRHDYTYHLLLANLYQQRFESGLGYMQARAFPHFLADAAVHFHERLQLGVPTAPGRATLLVDGRLDEQRTDRAAVARQVAAALAAAGAPAGPPPDPAALVFAYRARYDLDTATGWPVAVTATITCHSPAGYAKEYDLTIEQR